MIRKRIMLRDMDVETAALKVLDVDRLRNSVYGNPKWEIIAEDENGELYRGVTADNAAIGYQLSGYAVGHKYKFSFHYTRSGKLIFDRMSDEVKDSLARRRIDSRRRNTTHTHTQKDNAYALNNSYGKAIVEVEKNGIRRLYSYNTLIATVDVNEGTVELTPSWDYSATTLKHLKQFLNEEGFEATSKAQIAKDYLNK